MKNLAELKNAVANVPASTVDLVDEGEPLYFELLDAIKKANWPEAETKAVKLLEKTRDLRVAVSLTEALLNSSGLEGFVVGLQFINYLVSEHWEDLYPVLKDNNGSKDPYRRISVLENLDSFENIIDVFRTRIQLLADFTLRDIEVTLDISKPLAGKDKIAKSAMETLFKNFSEAAFATDNHFKLASEALNAIIVSISEKVESKYAKPRFAELIPFISKAHTHFSGFVPERPASIDTSDNAQEDTVLDGVESTVADRPHNNKQLKDSGIIQDRADVIKALDKICDYYKRIEPSSHVTVFLNRAKELVDSDFNTIVESLFPELLKQLEIKIKMEKI